MSYLPHCLFSCAWSRPLLGTCLYSWKVRRQGRGCLLLSLNDIPQFLGWCTIVSCENKACRWWELENWLGTRQLGHIHQHGPGLVLRRKLLLPEDKGFLSLIFLLLSQCLTGHIWSAEPESRSVSWLHPEMGKAVSNISSFYHWEWSLPLTTFISWGFPNPKRDIHIWTQKTSDQYPLNSPPCLQIQNEKILNAKTRKVLREKRQKDILDYHWNKRRKGNPSWMATGRSSKHLARRLSLYISLGDLVIAAGTLESRRMRF